MAEGKEKGDLYRKYQFEVEIIDGPKVGGFDKISGLNMQMETVQYREGGVNNYVHKLPGQYTHSTIVLENGIVNDKAVFAWMNELKWGEEKVEDKRHNVEVKIPCGPQKDERWGFEIYDAYPVQWDGPDLRSEASGDIARQTLELAHNGFTNLSGTPGKG